MQAHMKKHLTEELVPLHLMVHPANVSTITRYVDTLEKSDSIPWRDVAGKRGSVSSSILRGCRSRSLRRWSSDLRHPFRSGDIKGVTLDEHHSISLFITKCQDN